MEISWKHQCDGAINTQLRQYQETSRLLMVRFFPLGRVVLMLSAHAAKMYFLAAFIYIAVLCCTFPPLPLGDALLHSSSLLHADPLEGTLTIIETQDVDTGVYTCVAVNAAGTASGKISLDVGGKSLITVSQVQVIRKTTFIYNKSQTVCDFWSSRKTAQAHTTDSLTICEIQTS